MRVLGIDPGSRITGWALVESSGNRLSVLAVGTAAPRTGELAARLGSIAEQVERLIAEWGPESVAVERAFVGKNVLSALRLGEIRGAVLAVAGRHALPVVDYPPATVKLAVAGSGAAEKRRSRAASARSPADATRPATRPTRSRSRSATFATQASRAG